MTNLEWEARQRDREKKEQEWEVRKREREKKEREWEVRVNRSKSYLDTITSMARSAEPLSDSDSGLADIVLTIATGGLDALAQGWTSQKESLNQRASYLRSCSVKMREAWSYFKSNKGYMIGEDNAQAYTSLSSAQENLNSAWAHIEGKKQRAWESYQHAKDEKEKERASKRAAWEERQRVKVEKQRIWEEKKKAWEERQRLKAEKQKEWEDRQKERERKQKEWEERQRE